VGRHELARSRRKPSIVLAAVVAPTAVFFAAGGDACTVAAGHATHPVVDNSALCCLEIVAAAPAVISPAAPGDESRTSSDAGQFVSASRYRVVEIPRVLQAGVASERGLQVKTILVARSISAVFPEIHEIDGVRPDALRWHPDGLALDVMIPNPGSAEGIALGNQIVAFALKNAARFGLQDAIWRGTYYTPDGGRTSAAGHFDHVHITTTGGGYPTGGEIYYR
jgi:hypothetical protein